tara:strand:- start:1511 stop:2407 length:897 start_codon:yes stop_codon:yes gene_type:complete
MSVNMKKVDKASVNRALDKLAMGNSKWSLQRRVSKLVAHFKTKSDEELVECSNCKGVSTNDFDFCPFCGALDEEPGTVVVLPEKLVVTDELDESVTGILKLKVAVVCCYWELGRAIKENFDRELWKQRRNADGSIQHRDFKAFCRTELNMSHPHAYKLMAVASAYSRNQVEKLGTSKLHIVLKVPEAQQGKLLEAAEGGASKRELLDKAKKLKGDAPLPKKDRISIAVVPGRQTFPLYARQKSKTAEPKAARRLTDNPWFDEELPNGVKVLYRVSLNKKGEMVLIVDRRRILPSEKDK